MSTSENKKDWLGVGVAALAVYVALLLVTIGLGHWVEARKLSGVGEYFGGLANIVAMAGVVIALIMQKRELGLQRLELSLTRQELKAQREELARQAAALDAQLTTARNVQRFQHLVTLHQFLLDAEFRKARHVLINLAGVPLSEWGEGARAEAEKACAHWNFVGILVIEGVLPRETITDARYSITRCHDAARELLAEVRTTRSPDHWRHFTRLAQELWSSGGV